MKIYTEKKANEQKSWALRFLISPEESHQAVVACDAESGQLICEIFRFEKGGDIIVVPGVKEALKSYGYNEYEYNNDFNEVTGGISIKMEFSKK